MERYTNIHSHVFSGGCVPDYFLKTILPKRFHAYADEIMWILRSERVRSALEVWAEWRGPARLLRRNSKLLRIIQFLRVGAQNTQEEVFLCMKQAYAALGPNTRFVALTLNMDHMDVQSSSHARIEDQLAEIERVRAHYPDTFLPFVCADPRHKQGNDLRDWVKEKVERRAFMGIKLYPAIGYFPFDTGLDALYAWAEQNAVPIMTHCTRQGTFYTGSMAQVLPDPKPAGLHSTAPEMADIHARIKRFMNNDLTWDHSNYGCNIFLHPQNYEPVLRKYPRLKLCFAHFGGDDELLNKAQELRTRKLDDTNWHVEVKRIMGLYANVYTDISYTLHNPKVYTQLAGLIDGPLGERILFGTDCFMTLKEAPEADLLKRCMGGLGMDRFNRIAARNNDVYLTSTHFDPMRRVS
jgi:predicted TIM-barrel fold metal-dependent hydrolase